MTQPDMACLRALLSAARRPATGRTGTTTGHDQRLGSPLAYPVGTDTSGRVADGYGVQDQPWYVLTAASGKITWSHDGWLSLPALRQAVREHAAGH